jgi:hypothetical protein
MTKLLGVLSLQISMVEECVSSHLISLWDYLFNLLINMTKIFF